MPLAHDGMGVFNTADGKFRLVRNHEDRNGPGAARRPSTPIPTTPGAAAARRRWSSIRSRRELERDFISLSGTTVNCAGGVTPWDSWITCEETNAGTPSGWLKQHGYCFDVPAWADSSVPAVAIPSMGRFSHEAITVDPNTWIVYETEDNSGGGGHERLLPIHPEQCRASSSTAASCRCWPSRTASSTTRATTRRSASRCR